MKFLIDECQHTSPVQVAHAAGYAADHVNFLSLGGLKDWQLLLVIRYSVEVRLDYLLLDHCGFEYHIQYTICGFVAE